MGAKKILFADKEEKDESEIEEEVEDEETEDEDTSTEDDSTDDTSDDDEDSSSDDDEDVTIKQSELAKLKKDLKKSKRQTRKARKHSNKEKPEEKDESGFITKKDFYKDNEDTAITQATTPKSKDSDKLKAIKSEINDNWDDIIPFFNQSANRKSVGGIVESIFDAHTVWKRRTGGVKTDTDKDAKRELGADGGTGGGASGKTKKSTGKRNILKGDESMDTWYKTDRTKKKEKKEK